MAIRKQNLEEWFLCHQLESMARGHFHLPLQVDADVTALHRAYADQGDRPPYTAIMVKALALVAERHPAINRMVFRTFWGTRVVDFEQITVNVPLMLVHEGVPHLSAITVERANELPVAEIQDRIRRGKERDLRQLRIGRYFIANRNTLANRTVLRTIHFLVYNLPSLYVRGGGGGLSVSSLLNFAEPGFDCRLSSYGPTALTLTSATISEGAEGRWTLRIGIGFDHYACRGDEGVDALRSLARILSGRDAEAHARLLR